ncbi:MAG: hypothetical protein N2319_12885 [Candidatus Kapabacteria bacterium]|nr:hypothetical protein [Candidatus Kapabacteria bacterium]
MKRYLLFLVLWLCGFFPLLSQQKELPKTNETRPLELPTIFIEGKENLNVQSGTKQFLDKTQPLTKDDLDSINSLEKQISMLIPFKPLNESMTSLSFKKGYFSGEYGMYNTPKFLAGYKLSIDDYKLSFDGGLDLSQGHIKNSDYTKIFAKVGSEYIAPEKFLFFGGSLTTLDFNFKHNNYKLYAFSDATERSTTLLSLDIMSDGRYDVFDFKTGAQLKTHILSQSNKNTADNTINGFLNIDGNFENFLFGAGASIDFRNLRNNPYTFFEIYGKVKYDFNDLVFKGRGGIQMTQSTLGESRQGVIVDAELSYVFNNFFNAAASFSTSLEKNSFSTALELNPYITDSSVIDFAYPVSFQASVNYHPDKNFYIIAKGKYSVIDRTPYFLNADTGTFNLHYDKSSSLNFEIEGIYNFSDDDLLSVLFLLQNNELSSGKKVPYKEPFRLSGNYRKKWFESLRTNLEIFYVGSRYVDKENTKEVGGFIDFNFGGTYSFSKNFDVFLKIENLFNSDIKYWNGYKERDIFLTAGIFWKF